MVPVRLLGWSAWAGGVKASVTCCLLRVPVTQNSCPSMTCPCCGQEPSGLSCDLWPWGKAAGHIQASARIHSAWLRPGSPCGQVPAPRSLPASPTDRVRTSLHVNICLRNWYLRPSSSKCPPARENAGLLSTCCVCCVTSHPTQRASGTRRVVSPPGQALLPSAGLVHAPGVSWQVTLGRVV